LSLGEQVVVIVGSANQPPTVKNPFSVDDRVTMLQNSIHSNRVSYEHVRDFIHDDSKWASKVRKIISNYAVVNVAIIGHEKDESSFYLKMFKNWTFIPVELVGYNLSGSIIRDILFSGNGSLEQVKGMVPAFVYNFLSEYVKGFECSTLVGEFLGYKTNRNVYSTLPYPPVFVTVDVVFECNRHVLLIKRKHIPGIGLMALPGGFLDANNDKSLKHAAIRELIEETGIDIPEEELMDHIVGVKVFDAPNRSLRGRTITHVYHIKFIDYDLPYVKGSDDALEATFVPIKTIDSNFMFEDHFEIIMSFLEI
jgi:bifunctional NMN adenylyltransferase/nudix hydrolase